MYSFSFDFFPFCHVQRKINDDGLIYIDVVIDNKKKPGKKRNEIHGKDDMTEYTTIDFRKRADPLPDSDEEGK